MTLSRREKDWSVSNELLVITKHIICHISAEEKTVRKKKEMQIRIATQRFRHRDAQPEYCTSHGLVSLGATWHTDMKGRRRTEKTIVHFDYHQSSTIN